MNTPNTVVHTGARWLGSSYGASFFSPNLYHFFFFTFIKRKINGHVNVLFHFEKKMPRV